MKIPYKEGDWFAVPIKSGFVLARIARACAPSLVGYFFKPLYLNLPSENDTWELKASDAFDIARFGDLGFTMNNWPIISRPTNWNRDEWPMPPFGRLNDRSRGTGYLTVYDDVDLVRTIATKAVSAEEAMRHPRDGSCGDVYLQGMLDKYFTVGYPEYDPTEQKKQHIWFHGLPNDEV